VLSIEETELDTTLAGLNSSAWGNSPTGMTSVTEFPNTVPADIIMTNIVIYPFEKTLKACLYLILWTFI
jgi:hypothetical protein